MSEVHMESARAVNPANRQESALHSEIYSPTTQWASFETLNARSNEHNPNFLDMNESDPYGMEGSTVKAPEIGDPKRLEFRKERQQNAIFDGIKSGEIDFDEFTDLEHEQDLIAQVQEYFGANGLSEQDLQNLDLLQNRARKHIIEAGGADEFQYLDEGEKEPGPEKPPERKPPEEHGSDEKPEHGSKEKPKESGSEEKPEGHGDKEKPKESGPEEKPEGHGGEAEKFQQFMNFLDQDGDGQISLDELLQAFQAIDENQDGMISPEEFQKFMEKFKEQSKPAEQEAGGEKEPSGAAEAGGEKESEPEPESESEPESGGEHSSEPHEAEGPSDSIHDGSDRSEQTDGERFADAQQMKMIYIFPDSQQVWQKLNQDAPPGSMIVTLPSSDVSWDSDQPFDSIDPQLKANIAEASANGLNPMGYVGTRGATRPIEEVKAEIDSWYANAEIKGIYLGDSGNHDTSGGYHTDAATETYFQELGDYIQAKGGLAAVNGSGSPNPDYANKFIQGTHEGYANAMPESKEWQDEHPPGRFAAMLVGVEQQDIGRTVQQARDNHNGYVFIAPEYGKAPTENEDYWNEVIRSLRG